VLRARRRLREGCLRGAHRPHQCLHVSHPRREVSRRRRGACTRAGRQRSESAPPAVDDACRALCSCRLACTNLYRHTNSSAHVCTQRTTTHYTCRFHTRATYLGCHDKLDSGSQVAKVSLLVTDAAMKYVSPSHLPCTRAPCAHRLVRRNTASFSRRTPPCCYHTHRATCVRGRKVHEGTNAWWCAPQARHRARRCFGTASL